MNKTATAILFILILFLSTATIYASDDDSYSITQAFVDLTVQANGLLHVEEEYDYSFDGTFNGVYRDIPLKEGEKIDNINVWVDGAYSKLEVLDLNNGEKRLKIWLYSDAAHTKKISDTDVRVHISYDMENVVTLYNDIGFLQYKLWGEEWDVGVGSLNAVIHLPGDSDNIYYLNPLEYNKTSSINEDTIKASTTHISKGNFYELEVLMPLNDFKDATYAKHVNEDGKAQIIKNIEDYQNSRNTWNNVFVILGIASLISPIASLFIYIRYGREPKVDYECVYERELPTDDPPEVINALFENRQNIGTPDMKGFEAVILNLIDRQVFKLNVINNSETDTKELHIIFNKTSDGLSRSEKSVYNILHGFADGEDLNLSTLNAKLSAQSTAKTFMRNIDMWKSNVEEEYLSEDKLSNYFNRKGSDLIKFLSIGGLVAGVVILILGYWTNLESGLWAILGGIFLIIYSIVIMGLPEDIFGKWSESGRLTYLKWENFKKFLKDNSLINEHPPESIVIWKKYLIYGTALGVADNVYKAMKLHIPNIEEFDDDIYLYHYYGGYTMMHHAFITGKTSANPSSEGDFGSVGGGSGGGGGGAF